MWSITNVPVVYHQCIITVQLFSISFPHSIQSPPQPQAQKRASQVKAARTGRPNRVMCGCPVYPCHMGRGVGGAFGGICSPPTHMHQVHTPHPPMLTVDLDYTPTVLYTHYFSKDWTSCLHASTCITTIF